jgi:DNA-binding MarR family transcriptional regulator
MYINFKALAHYKISIGDVMILQMAKQQKNEDLGEYIKALVQGNEKYLDGLIDNDYLTTIKGTEKQSFYSKLRLTKKGVNLIDTIETPEIEEQDLIFFEWIEKVYKDRGKKIGNRKKTKLYIALFRVHSGITKNSLALLIKSFLEDEVSQKFSHIAEYVFFKPPNVFSVKFDIEQSKLYQFYLTHQEYFDKEFEKIKQ